MLGLRRKMKTMVKSMLGLDDGEAKRSVDWTVPTHQPQKSTDEYASEYQDDNHDDYNDYNDYHEHSHEHSHEHRHEHRHEHHHELADQDETLPEVIDNTKEEDIHAVENSELTGLELTMENVLEVVDEYIRPGLMSDGGDITILKIANNNVYVQLTGACQSCSSSIMTMKMGVEALLKEEFPTLNEVIDQTEYSVESMDF